MRLFRPLAVVVVACVAGLMVVPAPAWAHNELRASNPAKGALLAAAPVEVVLDFAERLDPRFTTVAVTDSAGKPVTAGKPQVDGVRAVQPLNQPLGAGDYRVAYRVVSVDGHPVSGSHAFTVTAPPPTTAPATPTALPTPTPMPAGATSTASVDPAPFSGVLPGDEDSAGNLPLALLVGGVAVLAIGAGFLIIRRRGTGPS